MKMKEILKKICMFVCLALLTAAAFTACTDGGPKGPAGAGPIAYEGAALSDGMKGTAYSASVATATGADGIAYALKAGGALPAGLAFDNGEISGTPTDAGDFSFVVTASADKAESVEATFTLKIVAPTVGAKTYIMEAEFIDLTDKYGSGWSNTSTEYNMVVGYGPGTTTQASNGYYLAFMTTPDMEFVWSFDADADGTGALAFSMVSEYGPRLVTPMVLTLKINGAVTPYIPFSLYGVTPAAPSEEFRDYFFLTNFAFRAGENTVSLTVKTNDWFPGRNGGPTVDYMKIISEADLTFNPFVKDNDELVALRGH